MIKKEYRCDLCERTLPKPLDTDYTNEEWAAFRILFQHEGGFTFVRMDCEQASEKLLCRPCVRQIVREYAKHFAKRSGRPFESEIPLIIS